MHNPPGNTVIHIKHAMEGNVMCTSCQVDDADLVCLCDYPLVALCSGQCLQKHRGIPTFHFEMPVVCMEAVNKDNFSTCQTWIFGISRAQQALRKNIAAIEAFEVEIEASFGHLEREIANLKGEYKAAIQTLKRNIAEMIDTAIGETTAQALTSNPLFTSPLSGLIWEAAHPGNPANSQLYRFSIELEADFSQLISIRMEQNHPLLPEFPLNSRKSLHKPQLSLSPPLDIVSIAGVVSENARGNMQQMAELHIDQNLEEVRREDRAEDDVSPPEERKGQISLNKSPKALLNCHNCGIKVQISEIEAASPCKICYRCVVPSSERSWLGLKRAEGACPIHSKTLFLIDKQYYRSVKSSAKADISACCPLGSLDGMRLQCGHYVCAEHKEELRSCRSCQTPVRR